MAESLVKEIEDSVNGKEIVEVYIILGELVPLTADELKYGIKQFRDWNIVILIEDAIVSCTCDYEGKPEIERGHDVVIWSCPRCGQYYPKVIKGDSIKIEKVIVSDDFQ